MHSGIKQLLTIALAALMLASAACSTTDSTEAKEAKLQPVDKDGVPILTAEQAESGIICKNEPVIGTRISRKTCTTAEQRERLQREAQEQTQHTQRRATGPTISGS